MLLWASVSLLLTSIIEVIPMEISVAALSGVTPREAAVLLWVPVSSLSSSAVDAILVAVGIAVVCA